jgi:hypothetical protein
MKISLVMRVKKNPPPTTDNNNDGSETEIVADDEINRGYMGEKFFTRLL